jgi:predicted RNA-binding protein with TRAM domain
MDDEWYEGLSAVLNIGEEYDVEIEELSLRGEGIARIQGQIVYVSDTKPGDKVKIKISQVGQRGNFAEVVK